MTKTELIAELNHLRRVVAHLPNALVRADATETIDKVAAAIEAMPEPANREWLQGDYTTARHFIAEERKMRINVFASRSGKFRTRKINECNAAGLALGRMAKALDLDTPAAIQQAKPEPRQAALIERSPAEVTAAPIKKPAHRLA